MLQWFRPISLVILIASVLVVMPHVAQAAQPQMERVSFDQVVNDDFLSSMCGFPVTREEVRNLTISTYDDGSQLVVLNGRNYDVFRGPGGWLKAQQTGMDRYTVNRDGTITDVAAGNFGIGTAPGSGTVFGGAGRVVTVYDPIADEIISLTTTGNFKPEDFKGFCGALKG